MVESNAADPCDNMTREQIRDHLQEMAERHIAARESYKSLKADAAKELYIWQGAENGVALTVCSVKAVGLTKEDFVAFQDPAVFPDNMHILDSIITCRRLDDDMGEGMYAMYQHIKTPMVVSNRCCFMCMYSYELPDGAGLIHMSTSKGMKPIE